MSEPKYLIVFPDCLVAPGCKTVGTWTLSRNRTLRHLAGLRLPSTWCVTLDPCVERRSPWLLWQKWTAKPSGRIVRDEEAGRKAPHPVAKTRNDQPVRISA